MEKNPAGGVLFCVKGGKLGFVELKCRILLPDVGIPSRVLYDSLSTVYPHPAGEPSESQPSQTEHFRLFPKTHLNTVIQQDVRSAGDGIA